MRLFRELVKSRTFQLCQCRELPGKHKVGAKQILQKGMTDVNVAKGSDGRSLMTHRPEHTGAYAAPEQILSMLRTKH